MAAKQTMVVTTSIYGQPVQIETEAFSPAESFARASDQVPRAAVMPPAAQTLANAAPAVHLLSQPKTVPKGH